MLLSERGKDAGMLESLNMQGFPSGTDRAGHLCSATLPLTTEAYAQPYLLFSSFDVECWEYVCINKTIYS